MNETDDPLVFRRGNSALVNLQNSRLDFLCGQLSAHMHLNPISIIPALKKRAMVYLSVFGFI